MLQKFSEGNMSFTHGNNKIHALFPTGFHIQKTNNSQFVSQAGNLPFKHVFSPPRNSKVHLEFHTGFFKWKHAVSQDFLVGEIMMFLDFRNLEKLF